MAQQIVFATKIPSDRIKTKHPSKYGKMENVRRKYKMEKDEKGKVEKWRWKVLEQTTVLRQKIYNIAGEDLKVISKDIYCAWAAINKHNSLTIFISASPILFIFLLNFSLFSRPLQL